MQHAQARATRLHLSPSPVTHTHSHTHMYTCAHLDYTDNLTHKHRSVSHPEIYTSKQPLC